VTAKARQLYHGCK